MIWPYLKLNVQDEYCRFFCYYLICALSLSIFKKEIVALLIKYMPWMWPDTHIRTTLGNNFLHIQLRNIKILPNEHVICENEEPFNIQKSRKCYGHYLNFKWNWANIHDNLNIFHILEKGQNMLKFDIYSMLCDKWSSMKSRTHIW